jgi:hypothetical protein
MLGSMHLTEISYLRLRMTDNTQYKIYGLFARLLNQWDIILADGMLTSKETTLLLPNPAHL